MRRMWSFATLLLQFSGPYLASAATLPPSIDLTSTRNLLSNNSHESVKCLSRPNATYPIYDSPLQLAMTFGHHQILAWQVTTFLQYALIDIKPNASKHPDEYVPRGFYIYHEPGHLGKVSVIPSFYNNFTWSDLYLVLHALAEYIVKAPHAYEMCVKIDFRDGVWLGSSSLIGGHQMRQRNGVLSMFVMPEFFVCVSRILRAVPDMSLVPGSRARHRTSTSSFLDKHMSQRSDCSLLCPIQQPNVMFQYTVVHRILVRQYT